MMSDLPPILIAAAKLDKLKWVVQNLPYAPVPLSERPQIELPEETGSSFMQNATLKAVRASEQFEGLVIASDGGVRIPALSAAWDELRTGRAAGVGTSEAEKANHLLSLMKDKVGEERHVYWSEAVALAYDGDVLSNFEMEATEGLLSEAYDPTNAIPGFWVYSLWIFPSLEQRYVDLSPEELAGVDVNWQILKAMVESWYRET